LIFTASPPFARWLNTGALRHGWRALKAALLVTLVGALLVAGVRDAAGAIASGNSGTGSGTASSLSWNHTVAAGTNRLLLVRIANSGTATVSGVTYGGTAMTAVGSTSSSSTIRASMYYLVAPAVGTASVVVTLSASANIVAASSDYNGVNQVTPTSGLSTSNGSGSTSVNSSVSSASGSLVVQTLAFNGGTASATVNGTTQTISTNQRTGSTGSDAVLVASSANGAASVALNWTLSSASPYAAVGTSLNAAAAGNSFVVTSVADTGGSTCGATCTLRQAINASNASGTTLNTISFNIPSGSCSAGICTISPTSVLPSITRSVTIDATTQSGWSSTPVVELRGSSIATAGTDGLTLSGVSDSTIKGLAIRNFTGHAVVIDGGNGNTIAGNHIGLNAAGTAAAGNVEAGIFINSSGNTIGGTSASARNVMSGNTNEAVWIYGGSYNTISGNYIGLNAAGTAAIGNTDVGIYIESTNNTIGGTSSGARNVISGNSYEGIYLETTATGTVVQGNYVGLNAAGTAAIANNDHGLYVTANGCTIGGTASGAGNVVSGNTGYGLYITSNSNTVQGNIVGLDASGNNSIGNNQDGVLLSGNNNLVGGGTSAARNVISGHTNASVYADGIYVSGSSNTIQGNYFGTDITGTLNRGNYNAGVALDGGSNNTVGGTTAGEGNLMAFNRYGSYVNSSASGNRILGNSMFSNSIQGIELIWGGGTPNGITPNDGAKTAGQPNLLMDFPVFTSATLSGTTLTVMGYVGSAANQSTFANARVEVFIADTNAAGNGQGKTYLGFVTTDASGNFNGPITVASGITGNTTRITGTATDSGNNTSEFGANVVVTASLAISGTVYEDINYGGGSGRSLSASSGATVNGARVELYSSAGAYVSATTTAGAGAYSFTGLAAGTYYVRVVSSTVASTRTGSTASLVGVMTYRTTAASGSVVAVPDLVGGTSPALVDPGNGGSGTSFNTSTLVFSAGLTGTAQVVAPVTLSSANISGVEFGFNFSTVVNTNDSGQGSLRQWIANANALGGESSLAQVGRTAGVESTIFQLPSTDPGYQGSWWRISPITQLPMLTSWDAVVDGTTQLGASLGNLWAGTPHTLKVEIYGNNRSIDGLQISGNRSGVKGMVINQLPNNKSGVLISGGTAGFVRSSYIGLTVSGTSLAAVGLGVYLSGNPVDTEIGGLGANDGNVIAGTGNDGVVATSGATGVAVRGNFIGTNATGTAAVGAFVNTNINQINGTTTFREIRNNVIGGTAKGIAFDNNDLVGPATGWSRFVIAGNHIGVGRDGSTVIANTIGISIAPTDSGIYANLIDIGGSAAADRNVIGGNGTGIYIGGDTRNLRILGNLIGRNAAGLGAANTGDGIVVNDSDSVTIGGVASGEANTVANNVGRGIVVSGNAQYVVMRGNSVHDNGGLGIDLGGNGVTNNDGAYSSGQPNQYIDTPVLYQAVVGSSTLTVVGHIGSAAMQTTFANTTVDLYLSDGSSIGEGKTYLGTLTADANGLFGGTVNVSGLTAGSSRITATTTDGTGNTSEFAPQVTSVALQAFRNGGFETTSAAPGTTWAGHLAGATAIDGWVVRRQGIEHIGQFWQPAEGSTSLDLSRNNAGGIQQTFLTVPGQTYSIVFALAGNANEAAETKTVTVAAAAGTTNFSFNTTGKTLSAMGWVNRSITFVATSEATTVVFDSQNFSSAGPALDNVRLVNGNPFTLSGTVFEDVNYGGGAGRSLATSGGVGVSGARVELYDNGGAFVSATTSASDGSYSFASLSAQNYYVRVVNSSVPSSRSGWSAGLVGVMSYRSDASSGTAVAVTDHVGGTNPALADAGNGGSGSTLNTTTQVFSAGISGTAQSVATVSFNASAIGSVDFGFNFSTIVNTNDSGQGSLRQFITNANALGGKAALAQSGNRRDLANSAAALPSASETSIFMIPGGSAVAGIRAGVASQLSSGVAQLSLSSNLPAISAASVVLDGSTQTANIGDSNSGFVGSGGTVGADALTLSQVAKPEVELSFTGLASGVAISANNVTVRALALRSTGAGALGNGAVALADGTSGAVIEGNLIGSSASALADPGAGQRASFGMVSSGADNGILRRNLIAYISIAAVQLNGPSSSSGWLIEGNEIAGIGLDYDHADGIALATATGTTVRGNRITGVSTQGVVVAANGGGSTVIVNNHISGNGVGQLGAASVQSHAVAARSGATGVRIEANIITANHGAGVAVNSGASDIALTRNLIWGNGVVNSRNGSAAAGVVDIDLNSASDDIDFGTAPYFTNNDAGDGDAGGNNLQNTPVLSAATVSGSVLTLTGSLNSNASGYYRIEFFSNSTAHPSGRGGGQAYLGFVNVATNSSGDATFSAPLSVSVALGTTITATAIKTDASYTTYSDTSEFAANVQASLAISGTVFEDLNYGGGAGRSQSASGGAAVSGARLELYNSSGAFVSATTSASNGSYSFAVPAAGSYFVRAVSGTVLSTRSGSSASLVPVLTYRTTAASGTAVAVSDFVGGTDPTQADPGNASSGATFNTTSLAFSAGLSGTAQAVAPLTISTGGVAGLDFGFNFTTVVNTNDSGAGSLRQAISNANALGNDATLAVNGRAAGIEHINFMIGNGTAAAGLRSSVNLFSGGVATIAPASVLPIVSTPMVLDARTQPGWSTRPIIELNGSGAGAGVRGIQVDAGSSTVGGFVVNRFTLNGIALYNNGGNTVVGNWSGLNAAGNAASPNGTEGMDIWGSYNNTIGGTTAAARNILSGNASNGIVIGGSTGSTGGNIVQGNWIGLDATGNVGIKNGSNGIFVANMANQIGGTASGAGNRFGQGQWHHVQLDPGAHNSVVQGNTMGLNASDVASFSVVLTGVRVFSNNNTIGGTAAGSGNTITGSSGAAVSVIGNATGNQVLGNSIHSNNGQGIDLGANGVTANDGVKTNGQPNLLMDTPVITAATLSGSALTLGGYVGTAAGQSVFANARIEFFVSSTTGTNPQGRTWLGTLTSDTSGNFSGNVTVPGGVTLTAGSTRLTATATDSSNNTSEFSPNVVFGQTISGNVFEDLNYGGGAGRSRVASAGAAVAAARLELYSSAGAYVSATSTAADGSYSFTGLAAGNYLVRVVGASVLSTRSGSSAAVVGVMSYRTDASSGTAVAVTDWVGGTNPALVDPGNGGSGTSMNTSSYVFSAGLSGTAQAIAPVTLGASNVSGIDFGFNFDTVVNTNDSGAGSLRQVLINANTLTNDAALAVSGRTAALEHVVFMIGNGSAAAGLRSGINLFSGGVASIAATSELPVTAPLTIDAQTQPGWSANPLIELNGAGAGSVAGAINASASLTLRGLVINRYSGAGVYLNGAASSLLQGNWIGLGNTGSTRSANSGDGVYLAGSDAVQIGGNSAAQRNVISGNGGAGVRVAAGSLNSVMRGNYIGLNASGSAALGNSTYGIAITNSGAGAAIGGAASGEGNVISGNLNLNVYLFNTSGVTLAGNLIGRDAGNSITLSSTQSGVLVLNTTGVTIGGTASGAGNVIAGNNSVNNSSRAGIVVGGPSQAAILGNSIYGNGQLGIDLASDGNGNGVSANDGAKSANVGNQYMDSPVITSARVRGNQLTLAGYVGSAAGQSLFAGSRVEFFVSDNDASGFGEGRTYLGALTTDASGNFNATLTMSVSTLAAGTKLTATATDSGNNTSEFGATFSNLIVDFVVNSNLDEADTTPGDGQCLSASGVCTLRAAIAELNALGAMATTPLVRFAIPGCTAYGAAGCVITPATALPTLTTSMDIDATTQSGWNSSSFAPMVRIDGSAASSVASGLTLSSGTSSVRGLGIGGFGQSGILISGGSAHRIVGNWIGLNADGTAAAANGGAGSATGGVYISGGSNMLIGGSTAADRNVLSGNGGAGIWVNSGPSHTLQGNYIGTNATGTAAVGNGRWGIVNAADDIVIGGSAPGQGNLISGNNTGQTGGIYIGGSRNLLRGNTIGMASDGLTALPNGDWAGIEVRGGSDNWIGGTNSGEGNWIAGNNATGVRLSGGAGSGNRILGNRIHSNNGLGIDLGMPVNGSQAQNQGVTANDGAYTPGEPNQLIDHPVFTGAGINPAGTAMTVFGYVGTGSGQALFAGARIEIFKAAPDPTGYGEGQVYLGFLTADANGRFTGTLNFTAGTVSIGDTVTATTTDASGNTSEFGPNWVSTTVAALTPAGFEAFETDTAAGATSGPLRTRVAGAAGTVDIIALSSSGVGLHPGFTGNVSLSWVDARNDTGAATGSCRASWLDLGSAGTAAFTSSARVTVGVQPPASATRVMRLKMSYTSGGSTVVACSGDAFAAIPASMSLAASDGSNSSAGTTRALANTASSGGVVHRAGLPFTVTATALDALGNVMTGYDGTPTLATTGCVLPTGCTAAALTASATSAVAGVYTHNSVSYAEVGVITLRLSDASYADIDSADTSAAARLITSASASAGRFVPDTLTASISLAPQLATANGACLASGSGATFFGQGFGWATTPQVTVTARNASGAITQFWSGALMKLTLASATASMAASGAGSATLASSFGTLGLSDLGAGRARYSGSALDRFVLDLPSGTQQVSLTPSLSWSLAVSDASEAAVVGNPTLTTSATQAGLNFDAGALFHSGRLSLAPGHGDARSGVQMLLQLQRYAAAGWVTMTEDRGCVTVVPANLGVEAPSGVFASVNSCAAPATASSTTRGGRAWIALPGTPAASPGRLTMRLAGAAATGNACASANVSQALLPLNMPWLLGGSSAAGPVALATWGRANQDVVLRRETW
jgi:choice-of-anchor C domain-containing protein